MIRGSKREADVSERTKKANEAEIAAVTEVVRAYYDGTMAGDEANFPASDFADEHGIGFDLVYRSEYGPISEPQHIRRQGDRILLDAARFAGVGTWEGELDWVTRDEYIAECQAAVAEAGHYDWRIDGMSFEGDTAHVRLRAQHAGVYYSDDLSLVKDDDTWRIVHKTYYAHSA